MNKCKNCGNHNASELKIVTETTFGQGDSGHKTFVQCKCGAVSNSFSGYGFFEDSDLRLAQEDWNKNNPE